MHTWPVTLMTRSRFREQAGAGRGACGGRRGEARREEAVTT